MNIKTLVTAAVCLALAACNYEAADSGASVGTLRVALTGVDEGGQTYRLRQATFDISGYSYLDGSSVMSSVSSETDVDAEVIAERLLPGSYTVTLADGWHIERQTPDGFQPVAQAILLSSRQQSVGIAENQSSQVYFQFGVDGSLIDFHHGDLVIGITVVRAQAGAGAEPEPEPGAAPSEPEPATP